MRQSPNASDLDFLAPFVVKKSDVKYLYSYSSLNESEKNLLFWANEDMCFLADYVGDDITKVSKDDIAKTIEELTNLYRRGLIKLANLDSIPVAGLPDEVNFQKAKKLTEFDLCPTQFKKKLKNIILTAKKEGKHLYDYIITAAHGPYHLFESSIKYHSPELRDIIDSRNSMDGYRCLASFSREIKVAETLKKLFIEGKIKVGIIKVLPIKNKKQLEERAKESLCIDLEKITPSAFDKILDLLMSEGSSPDKFRIVIEYERNKWPKMGKLSYARIPYPDHIFEANC